MTSKTTTATTRTTESQSKNKEDVRHLLKSIETGEPGPAAAVNPSNYKQHNLAVADGLAGFGALLASLPKGSAKVHTVRILQDGDYVIAHTDYNFFGPKVGFDIFRFQAGKIVEHWDNLQEKPAKPNPSGHTMLDGATTIADRSKTEENKKLVRHFVEDVLMDGKAEKLATYLAGESYTQHNPQIGDGISGLTKALQALETAGINLNYDKVHGVFGEGNFVLTVSEGTFGGKPSSFYDLFRVHDGKIAEHWDVIEEIAPQKTWKNPNGKFGFGLA